MALGLLLSQPPLLANASCFNSPDDLSAAQKSVRHFVMQNYRRLSLDIATGQGAYLEAYIQLANLKYDNQTAQQHKDINQNWSFSGDLARELSNVLFLCPGEHNSSND